MALPSLGTVAKAGGKMLGGAGQIAASVTTTGIAAYQTADALAAEGKMAALAHEARQQGLWSVATKQADSQSARMAKQSEAWGQI